MIVTALTALGDSISQTVETNAMADRGDFPLRAEIYVSHSSLHAPAACYIVN